MFFGKGPNRVRSSIYSSVFGFEVGVPSGVVRAFILRSCNVRRSRQNFHRAKVKVTPAKVRYHSFRSGSARLTCIRRVLRLRAVPADPQYNRGQILRFRATCLCTWVYRGGSFVLGAKPSLRAHEYPFVIFSARRERAPVPRPVIFSGSASRSVPMHQT